MVLIVISGEIERMALGRGTAISGSLHNKEAIADIQSWSAGKCYSTMSTIQHLVRMANDIGDFFRAQRREEAIAGIENHLRSFWTPRMREKLGALLASGDSGLDELPAEALRRINHNKDKKPLQSSGGDAG
jgi:formate dehydrogenase subunit delta